MGLEIVPINFKDANDYVSKHHRHHKKVVGCKFNVACANSSGICGVAIIGRPVARSLDDGFTLEVNRVCTDGTKNSCSILYAAAWRAARALGYKKLVTYILSSESGASLRGAGFARVSTVKGRTWSCKSRPRQDKVLAQFQDKIRYEKT